ncbi:MAG: carbamate kinase [Acidobacteriota bacterium]
MDDRKIALIAFGGNALIERGKEGTQGEQLENAARVAEILCNIVEKGFDLILVHGNGPQVGNILIQVEEAVTKVPPLSLDVCVAQSEGSIGYMLEKALSNSFRKRGIKKDIVTILTEVEVSKDDPALKNPTKPIGPFYTAYRAEYLMAEKKWTMVEDSGRGYRKVVPSPKPIAILKMDVIKSLITQGYVLIAAGGGGIPVYRDERGFLHGIEAVIDKDYAAALIAKEVGVDLFIILTDIEKVYLNYGKKSQKELSLLTLKEAKRYFQQGQFPPGSMGPKVEAAIDFVETTGKEVLITSISSVKDAIEGKSGTLIIRESLPLFPPMVERTKES